MGKIPFKKFIIALLFCGKDVNAIVDKLKSFHYLVAPEEVSWIFDDVRSVLPKSIIEILDASLLLRLDDETHIEWLKYFDVFEIYDHILRSAKNIKNPPNYFKWCDDCVWIHTHEDIMLIVNIFLFNDEPVDTISDVLIVKFKRKIGVDALELYKKIFWDMTDISAKGAMRFCIPFVNNALIIRQFRTGSEIAIINEASHDGCDVPFHFHDVDYIKWKIGYKVEPPKPKAFLEKVQTDSMYKYYEAMAMTQSIEIEEETGNNDMGGFDNTKTKRCNVEEMKVNAAKKWLDIYVKAKEHMPDDRSDSDDFFKKMNQLELGFDDCKESIANINDLPDVMGDIAGDKANL